MDLATFIEKKEKFDFKLHERVWIDEIDKHLVFHAKLGENEVYTISWEENGVTDKVEYSLGDVMWLIKDGYWILL